MYIHPMTYFYVVSVLNKLRKNKGLPRAKKHLPSYDVFALILDETIRTYPGLLTDNDPMYSKADFIRIEELVRSRVRKIRKGQDPQS